jgi:hypothetical protein
MKRRLLDPMLCTGAFYRLACFIVDYEVQLSKLVEWGRSPPLVRHICICLPSSINMLFLSIGKGYEDRVVKGWGADIMSRVE